jgi:hypothetical protein
VNVGGIAHRGVFAKSLWFAAFAAGVLPLWWLLTRPILGAECALGAYFVAVVAAYLASIAPTRGRALAVAAVASAAGGLAALLTPAPGELAVVLAVLVAVARSGFLYRCAPARGVAIETIVAGGGLLFARFLGGPSVAGLVLSLWGFFLAQSLYVLLGGTTARAVSRHPDPFQDAYGRALALLDHPEKREAVRLT